MELRGVDVVHENGFDVLLHAVDWRIATEGFWVVGGRPAVGKTSLLATAAGLNRPGGGTLSILGRELAEATEEEQEEWRRRIGFVFENGGRLLHHLSVAENLTLPLRYHLDSEEEGVKKKVDELLERAELTVHAHAMPSRLSLRAQQRVSLMRALAVPVQVLFLDSPLRGLSAREERWWLEMLQELRRCYETPSRLPLTIVASSDDFRGWIDLASHFALIHGGRFRALGGREQLTTTNDNAVLELM